MDGEGSGEPTHFLQKSIRVAQKEKAAGENHGWAILDKVTPSTNNLTLDGDSKSTTMGKTDPYGVHHGHSCDVCRIRSADIVISGI